MGKGINTHRPMAVKQPSKPFVDRKGQISPTFSSSLLVNIQHPMKKGREEICRVLVVANILFLGVILHLRCFHDM